MSHTHQHNINITFFPFFFTHVNNIYMYIFKTTCRGASLLAHMSFTCSVLMSLSPPYSSRIMSTNACCTGLKLSPPPPPPPPPPLLLLLLVLSLALGLLTAITSSDWRAHVSINGRGSELPTREITLLLIPRTAVTGRPVVAPHPSLRVD